MWVMWILLLVVMVRLGSVRVVVVVRVKWCVIMDVMGCMGFVF